MREKGMREAQNVAEARVLFKRGEERETTLETTLVVDVQSLCLIFGHLAVVRS